MPNVVVRDDSGKVLERFVEIGTALSDALARVNPEETQLLRWLDPYTDTVFNTKQVVVVRQDLQLVRERCQSDSESAAIEAVLRLADEVSRYHRYLVFVGD